MCIHILQHAVASSPKELHSPEKLTIGAHTHTHHTHSPSPCFLGPQRCTPPSPAGSPGAGRPHGESENHHPMPAPWPHCQTVTQDRAPDSWCQSPDHRLCEQGISPACALLPPSLPYGVHLTGQTGVRESATTERKQESQAAAPVLILPHPVPHLGLLAANLTMSRGNTTWATAATQGPCAHVCSCLAHMGEHMCCTGRPGSTHTVD